jgi:hypothetical protein
VAVTDPIVAITCVMSLSSDLIPSSPGAGADSHSLGAGLEAEDEGQGSQAEDMISNIEPAASQQCSRKAGSKVQFS